jgi:hypothetical protein
VSDVPPAGFPPNSGAPWGPPPLAFKRPSRWPTLVAIAIGLIGVAVGFVGWFRPVPHDNPPPAKPVYTAQQVAEAKETVCSAFEKVHQAVESAHTHVGSNDYATQLAAVALNDAALDAGSRYLLTKLAGEPATQPELATAVRNEANAEQEALIGYLNGLAASDPQMLPSVNASNEASAIILRLCK